MGLSDVFKFTQGLGQRGHQIGRKVGDAVELLTLGMISLNEDLKKYLVLENGVEGATTAKHKVEFTFYNLNNELLGVPVPTPDNLFGIIECKKVGVEQTIKYSFKTWLTTNKGDFYRTNGYSFSFSSWRINIIGEQSEDNNVKVIVTSANLEPVIYRFACSPGLQILLAIDDNNQLFVLAPGVLLSSVERSIDRCIVIEIKDDILGFGRIHIQAKRYKKDICIGREDIQKFVGALAVAQSNKGVFITTSYFAKTAVDYVKNLNGSTTIVLIDGNKLAEYIYDYGLGMQIEDTLQIKKLDADYWDSMKNDEKS